MFLLNEQMHNFSLWFQEEIFFLQKGDMWYLPAVTSSYQEVVALYVMLLQV